MKKLLLFGALAFGLNAFGQTNTYSLDFDGVNDYVAVTTSNNFNNTFSGTNPFSIGFWLKLDTISPYQELISKGQYWTDANEQFVILLDGGNGDNISFVLYDGNTSNWIRANIQGLNTNVWEYWTFTYDGGTTATSLKVYRDNNELSFTPTNMGVFSGIQGNNDSLYFASRYDNNGDNVLFTDGKMDDISIWDYALDSLDIDLYKSCLNGSEQGLVGYWNFEEGAGTTAGDLTSNGNDGTLTNGPTWSTDVPAYNCGVGIEELLQTDKELVKIIDFMGRETEFKPNTPLIFIYSDGTRERVLKLEE